MGNPYSTSYPMRNMYIYILIINPQFLKPCSFVMSTRTLNINQPKPIFHGCVSACHFRLGGTLTQPTAKTSRLCLPGASKGGVGLAARKDKENRGLLPRSEMGQTCQAWETILRPYHLTLPDFQDLLPRPDGFDNDFKAPQVDGPELLLCSGKFWTLTRI